jgi:RNA polymerase sigma-32 factor
MIAIDSGTARFIEMAQRAPRLSRDDELALVERLRAGDRAAKDRLVTAHLREVVFIALRYRRYGVAVADLIAEGNLGLLRAVEKFDTGRGVRFATYAAHWIRSFVVGHVLASWSIACPRTGVLRTKVFFRLRRERAKLEGRGLPPSEIRTLLAEELGVSERKIASMLARLDSRDMSLEAPAHTDSKATLGELIASDHDPERACEESRVRTRLAAAVEEALNVLDPRERLIVDSRWLADPEDEASLAEIGRALGVSRERVRQLEMRARKRVAKVLERTEHIGRDWLDASAA